MLTLVRFFVLCSLKGLSNLLCRTEVIWIGNPPTPPFKNARIGIFLNHTSLYDVLFLGSLPASLMWKFAHSGVIPGADITIKRPFVGMLFKLFAAKMISISRQKDETWDKVLAAIDESCVIAIAAEGRMKRPDGLDKHGQPMTVRGGVADILWRMTHGNIIFTISKGMHHVQVPGQKFPRLFQKISVVFEAVPLESYKAMLGNPPDLKAFKLAVVKDLEARRDRVINSGIV